MEKYTKWRDPATGIHPFLPNKGKTDYDSSVSRILWGLKRGIIGPVLVIVRLPLIFIVFVWLLLFSFIFSLIPIPIIKRGFVSYVNLLGARALLFFMGFYWIETKYFPLSKQRKTELGRPGTGIKSGDVIIANLTSYIDVLYLTFRFSPTFAITPNTWDSPPKGKVIKLSLLGMLNNIIHFPVSTPKEALPLAEVANISRKNGNGPVVVFPEGATSNGRTILEGLPVLTEGIEPANVHVLGFKYNYDDFAPTFTVDSFFWHLLLLLSQVHNSLQVRYMTSADMPPLPLDGSSRPPTSADRLEWADAVFKNLASILQLRKSTLNAMDKREFLKYWYSHKKSYKEN